MLKLIKMLVLTSRGLGLKQKVMPHRPLLRELDNRDAPPPRPYVRSTGCRDLKLSLPLHSQFSSSASYLGCT